ncbi:ATP-binding protein [Desulfovermiculus halophilus]|uniref:ATP-binding protein n=1 Tax=Desulfovermiculus halophilus TaxID=339722 RepID=UPI00048A4110|nr:4Fe-4S binding protein [Desulfovermiculus halophilus]
MADVYTRLARHLDSLPAGFPATESGVELKILRKLFTPQEAEIASTLSMMPQTPESLAPKLGMEPDELANTLEEMARKGLIFRYRRKGTVSYMAAQFVVGIWEYHVNDLDEELVRYFNEYVPALMRSAWERTRTKQMRVIPVSEDVQPEAEIMPFDQAAQIVASQSRIAVADCICRKERGLLGEACDAPLETCLVFGGGADFYLENGLGREIDKDEALRIVEKGKQAGLVLQPSNAQKPVSLCMCCGCCCQILRNVKRMDTPARHVHTNFQARVDPDLCTGCGVCQERCPMQAIVVQDAAEIDPDRCIGCGVCVNGCEFEALHLGPRDDGTVYEPPKNVVETYMNMARERMEDA